MTRNGTGKGGRRTGERGSGHPVEDRRSRLERLAAAPRRGLLRELWGLLRATRKWWLAPIIALLLLAAALVLAGGSGLAPFIYTLF